MHFCIDQISKCIVNNEVTEKELQIQGRKAKMNPVQCWVQRGAISRQTWGGNVSK